MKEYGIIISMQKNTVTKILIVILTVLMVVGGTVIDALWLAPKRLNVRQETIQNEKIPETLNDMRICYLTDLDYGLFVDEQRLTQIIEQINATGADIVIFGGDLYEDTITPNETGNSILKEALSSIEAPYGKFAVPFYSFSNLYTTHTQYFQQKLFHVLFKKHLHTFVKCV